MNHIEKPGVLEHFEKTTISNAKERLKKLISEANKYKLRNFAAGLATAVEILEEEEIEKLEAMFNMQQSLDKRIIAERNIKKTLDEWVIGITKSEIDELAERVHKLALDWSELVDERNRYKQALEEISNADWKSEGLDAERELYRITDIAFKALEGTE